MRGEGEHHHDEQRDETQPDRRERPRPARRLGRVAACAGAPGAARAGAGDRAGVPRLGRRAGAAAPECGRARAGGLDAARAAHVTAAAGRGSASSSTSRRVVGRRSVGGWQASARSAPRGRSAARAGAPARGAAPPAMIALRRRQLRRRRGGAARTCAARSAICASRRSSSSWPWASITWNTTAVTSANTVEQRERAAPTPADGARRAACAPRDRATCAVPARVGCGVRDDGARATPRRGRRRRSVGHGLEPLDRAQAGARGARVGGDLGVGRPHRPAGEQAR